MDQEKNIGLIVNKYIETGEHFHFYDILNELFIQYTEVFEDEDYSEFHKAKNIAIKFLFDNNYIDEENPSSLSLIESRKGVSWYKPENGNKWYLTQVPTEFLVDHLEWRSKKMFSDSEYMPKRSEAIRQSLEKGTDPYSFSPISLYYDLRDNHFSVVDGIHRIQLFHEKKIPYINTDLSLENINLLN